jgi:hypothetical protein
MLQLLVAVPTRRCSRRCGPSHALVPRPRCAGAARAGARSWAGWDAADLDPMESSNLPVAGLAWHRIRRTGLCRQQPEVIASRAPGAQSIENSRARRLCCATRASTLRPRYPTPVPARRVVGLRGPWRAMSTLRRAPKTAG